MADLRLDDVWMSYPGSPPVLRGLSLEVANGEFYAMVGPSGSGKTSILRVLAGFVDADAGRVLVDGQPVDGVPPERRDLGIVFQSYALFPHMTVAENIAFGLRMRRLGAKLRRQKVTAMLDLVGLPEFERRYPDELSGGQQQRVALARALVTEPKALLLDEPLSALDRMIRQEMQVELRRIQRETGVTAVIVTHDQEEALALGDRLMVLDGGEVQQEGSPREVYSHPRNRFVATFLGEANLFSARVSSLDPSVVTVGGVAASGLRLPEETAVGTAVDVCVRPERWHLVTGTSAEGDTPDGLRLTGRVQAVQLTGQVAACRIATPLGEVALTVLSSQAQALEEGTPVQLRASPGDAHVLDQGPGSPGDADPATAAAGARTTRT